MNPEDAAGQRVFRAQLDLLRRKNGAVLAGNVVTSGLLVLLLWPMVPDPLLLAWFAAHLGLSAIRLDLARRYDRAGPGRLRRWSLIFIVMSAASGLIWGMLAVLFLEPEQVGSLILITLGIAGMCSAALGALSVHPPGQSAFALTSVGLLIAALLANGYADVAALTVVFLVADLVFTHLLGRSIRRSLELRFENEDLVAALQEQHRLAEQASRDKTDLLAAASHDLRQPVHAMGFFVDALEGQPMSPEGARLVGRIKRSLWSLDGLFHSLLEMSRLEAGVIVPERAAVAVEPILAGLVEEYEPLARRRSLRLAHVRTGVAVDSDPVLLERMLRNLVSNAVRYTRAGGVVMGVRRRRAGIAIEVRDTGPGMSEEECSAAFEAFRRLEQRGDELDPAEGLGLGLAIVGHLSRLLEHPLEIDSKPGRGSTFRVHLQPTSARPRAAPARLAVESRISGLRVLVVDDDPDVCDGLQAALERWGCSVHVATSENEAFEVVSSPPDAIIADYRLARHTTGAQLVQRIEQALERPIPSLLITGDTAPEQLEEARATGYRVLRKPVAPAHLRMALHKALRSADAEWPAA